MRELTIRSELVDADALRRSCLPPIQLRGWIMKSRIKRSYCVTRSSQIGEHAPQIGRCDGRPIYEWIRLTNNPAVKYEFAGLAPQPLPATLFEPGKTLLALVLEPGLAYEPIRQSFGIFADLTGTGGILTPAIAD